MKLKILTICVMSVFVAACSNSPKYHSDSNPSGKVASGNQVALSEQRATQDFKRTGIKIEYATFSGSIDAIEVTGYAPIFGNSSMAVENAYKVAELDAKRKLNDFINRENIESSTSINMITNTLEKSIDNKQNGIANNQVSTSDSEVSAGAGANSNTATRQDALRIATKLQQNMMTSSRGILGGLRMVDNEAINGGRNVRVVFRWESDLSDRIVDVRRAMMK